MSFHTDYSREKKCKRASKWRETETERQRQTDRDRQTDRQTDRDRQAGRQADRQADRQTEKLDFNVPSATEGHLRTIRPCYKQMHISDLIS